MILGAFGAHALHDRLDARSLEVFQTGVQWQAIHALALLATAIVALGPIGGRAARSLAAAGIAFVVGTVLFSGSLYALALTGVKGLGAITPFGGFAFVLGWAALASAFVRGGPPVPGSSDPRP